MLLFFNFLSKEGEGREVRVDGRDSDRVQFRAVLFHRQCTLLTPLLASLHPGL